MKNLIRFSLLIILISTGFTSCNLSRTAVVSGTVKDLVSTTCDYYDFYHPAYGKGVLKECDGTITRFNDNPELPIRVVPSPDKKDLGYFIIKKAGAATSLDSGATADPGELVLRQREFELKKFAQRGN